MALAIMVGSKALRAGAPQKRGSLTASERSAHFARREAAKVLRCVLQGHAQRRAVASIKSLVYSPSVRNKRATFALVCQTLKHLNIIKDVLEIANLLNSKWKRQEALIYILSYDVLFGQQHISDLGDIENYVLRRKGVLKSALAQLLVRKNVKSIKSLVAPSEDAEFPKLRYVRVNTLKIGVDAAMLELEKQYMVKKDDLLSDLLVLPPGSQLHDHPLVTSGSAFLQGKASSMVAAALDPVPGWEVLDACSAPGNKTTHLAALMQGKGRVIACELNKDRAKRLEHAINLSGAVNTEVMLQDFLSLDPLDPNFAKVRAVLLDPSCSGSGTTADRMDNLLPSRASENEQRRLQKLATFQSKALAHAFLFPQVERIVYSTCSIHQIENEDVVKSALHIAASRGFELVSPFPQWPRRGLPVFEGSERLLRTDPVIDKEGFFIALFAKTDRVSRSTIKGKKAERKKGRRTRVSKKRSPIPFCCSKILKTWLERQPVRGETFRLNAGRKVAA